MLGFKYFSKPASHRRLTIPHTLPRSGRASGIIIDTPASFTVPGLGTAKGDRTRYSIVRHAIEALKVDLLLVIGNEKLAIEMEKLFSPAGVQVLRVTKSSGVRRCKDHASTMYLLITHYARSWTSRNNTAAEYSQDKYDPTSTARLRFLLF